MMPYIDILFFAAIAIFLAIRLSKTLGKKTGNEEKIYSLHRSNEKKDKPSQNVVIDAVVEEKFEFNELLNAQIRLLQSVEKDFSISHFIHGAKNAFETILDAYAKGEKETLKHLCSKEIYNQLSTEIDERNKLGHINNIKLIGFNKLEIKDISMVGVNAKIAVEFITEQVFFTKNAEGVVINGNEKAIVDCIDNWLFERKLGSGELGWLLFNMKNG